MGMLGFGAYAVPTCVDASSISGGLPPSLDRDLGDTVTRYQTYSSDDCADADLMETVELYGYPHEEGALKCTFTGLSLQTRQSRCTNCAARFGYKRFVIQMHSATKIRQIVKNLSHIF